MISSTVLTLIVIPALYALVKEAGLRRARDPPCTVPRPPMPTRSASRLPADSDFNHR